jgi:anthrone oxygenase-like protein
VESLGGRYCVSHVLVVVPLWSSSPPESVRAFFQHTDFNRTIGSFFGPPWMAVRMAPLIGALLMGWRSRPHRVPLVVALLCMLFGLIYTLAYIYPINSVLMAQAGGSGSPDEIRAMVERWILADRLRFVVGAFGFLALLRAFSLPADHEAA